ncbi:MAG: OmpA family protein [Pseudomonadota bacterium]
MKKIVMSFATSIVVLAIGPAAASGFSGGYLGGKLSSNNTDISGAAAAPGNTATSYGLQGGRGWDKENFMLGVEGFYDHNRQSGHAAISTYGSNVYGVDFKLGLPLDNFLPYAKLGYAHTGGFGAAAAFSGSAVHSGFGVEYKFTTNWSVAGEWSTSAPSSNGSALKNNNSSLMLNYYFLPPRATAAAAPVVTASSVTAVAPIAPQAEPITRNAPTPLPVAAPADVPGSAAAMKSILISRPVLLQGANFASSSAQLLPSANKTLGEVVAAARQYPDVQLEVGGHADASGNKAVNQKLSEERASAVKRYLMHHGVAGSRITATGYGDTRPIADNQTVEGRTANRRVEVRYVLKEETKVQVDK